MKEITPRIYKNFDLPTVHLNGKKLYVPPKARKSKEIERRHFLPRGVLVLEFEHRGLKVGAEILKRIQDPQDIKFATNVFAPAALNTAHLNFESSETLRLRLRQEAETMRRVLNLPLLAAGDPASTPHSEMLQSNAAESMLEASNGSNRIGEAIKNKSKLLWARQKQHARFIGNIALVTGCVGLASQIPDMEGIDDFGIQFQVRKQSLSVLEAARNMDKITGTSITFAGLADPNSDFSVHLRRNAPNGVLDAFEFALAEHVLTAA